MYFSNHFHNDYVLNSVLSVLDRTICGIMISLNLRKGFFILLLFAVCMIACKSEIELSSGIEGQVIRGPIKGGPEIIGEVNEEPFSALFHVQDPTEKTVKSFTSDENGEFKIQLPPGEYSVVPDNSAPLMMPSAQSKKVTVSKDLFLYQVFYFDTGIR